MNNVLTASRMVTAMQCLRKHYWQYEIGLRRTETGLALRIGSAWHRGMEQRWLGKTFEEAIAAAIPENSCELDNYSSSTIAALLAGYYDHWGKRERTGKINPEVQFKFELQDGFTVEGKIDGLGTLKDRRSVLIESKTTSDNISFGSDYWLRLTFNMQVFQYVLAARELGWDISEVIYDVTRKPQIRPKEMPELYKNGQVIVRDSEGNRVYKRDGEAKASADKAKGEYIIRALETPAQFGDRLFEDTKQRPDFYFARKEVPILDQELEAFELQRIAILRLIVSLRENESSIDRPENAWPRNVSEATCTYCPFKNFCLQNLSVDLNNPPEGFAVGNFNPELEYDTTTTEQTTDSAS